ncbi:DUF6928 family protein [Actinoallomurus sp. CA-150999]|uniref:DUF6928 family protein n=1 Tax=Actinoallomurus sp. CA-150999 TaxID=3239887 RepID=UPI003D929F3A
MGAKDWMLMYADAEVRPILQSTPPIDRGATAALVERLHPGRHVSWIGDGTLSEQANPPDHQVYAGCFAELTIVCSGEVALDRPSALDPRFLEEAAGRTVYLHAMHSVVDWFAYAVWEGDGALRRSLSLAPDHGIMERIGMPMAFEEPYWAGEHPLDIDDDEDERLPPYPFPFHPLDLAEGALRALFGFNYEGLYHDDDPNLEDIVLMGFAIGSSASH